MLDRSARSPDETPAKTKVELEALGLADPTVALHHSAIRDFYVVPIVFLTTYLAAILFDLGDLYREASARYEDWEYDEIFVASLVTMGAFAWFAWRQWRRYADELTRRLRLEEQLVEMQVMASSVGDNKAELLANIRHDLQTPLNGILSFAQLLEEAPFGPLGNERYKQYVASIRTGAAMLGERLATCLDPDKVEFGAEPLQMRPWPIDTLIRQVLPIVEPVATNANIRIELELAQKLPDLHADHRAIKKVLVNLVSNAIRFNRPHGLVRISTTLSADKALVVTIEDNGVGLAKDALDRRWVQPGADPAPASDSRERYGLGTGLGVASRLLDAHGATMTIESIEQRGTKVSIAFPPDRLVLERPPVQRKLA
jgi:signal transduction histidine kinase